MNSVENSLGPRPAPPGPATPLSAARAALLDLIRAQGGPCTVEDLVRATDQHPNTVREHLEALVGAGLAAVVDGPAPQRGQGKRGRPAKHYLALEPESRTEGYAGLAGVLAAEVARLAPDPVAAGEDAGRRWARRSLGPAPAPASAPDARRRVLAELDDLGFGVEPRPEQAREPVREAASGQAGALNESETVRLVSCPLLAAAKDEPGVVCAVHAGLVDESLRLLGHPDLASRLEPFAEPGACLLTIGRR